MAQNGDLATNTIFRNYHKNTKEYIFYELIGSSADVPKGVCVKGKQKYSRLFIRRVYPVTEVIDNTYEKSELIKEVHEHP